MPRPDRSRPMPVKHWTFAGLLLTYWCNARCASCYLCGAPGADAWMSVEDGLAFWEGLQSASPHGCRIHISGGEPFGRWETLIELARRAHRAGLGPLEAVETNAFWARDEKVVRERLRALDDAGMGRLTISADPYHQQYVPIERVRLAARVSAEVLGEHRVRVRWRDWLEEGQDTGSLPPPRRRELFARYARGGRDRLTGRAAEELAGLLELKSPAAFADDSCGQRLLRSRHVHVDPAGLVSPGTCAGIVLGRAGDAASIGLLWRDLAAAFGGGSGPGWSPPGRFELLAVLVRGGPVALLERARRLGYVPRPGGYAAKCHLCWDVRRWLGENGYFPGQLGPEVVYKP